jgi:hypothetical protein
MELSKATDKTFTVEVASHTGFEVGQLRAVRAHAVIAPSFPRQITLFGELSDEYRLVKPLAIDLEADSSSSFVASEGVFYIYGTGQTRAEAVKDYIKSLCEYYELLSEQTDGPTVALFSFLSSYVQPVDR